MNLTLATLLTVCAAQPPTPPPGASLWIDSVKLTHYECEQIDYLDIVASWNDLPIGSVVEMRAWRWSDMPGDPSWFDSITIGPGDETGNWAQVLIWGGPGEAPDDAGDHDTAYLIEVRVRGEEHLTDFRLVGHD